MTSTTTPAPAFAAYLADPVGLYALAIDQAVRTVTAIRSDQWGDPTPCDELDVRELVAHLIGGACRSGAIAHGEHFATVDAFAPLAADEDPRARFAEAAASTVASWAAADLDAVVEVPWGRFPGTVALAGYLMEVATHTWDVATATGQDVGALDPTIGEAAEAAARQALPDATRFDLPFGSAQHAPADADPYTRLAAWLGRQV